MALITYDLEGRKHDKVQIAIERLQAFEPPDGYYLAFSGGKDSQCIYHLAEMAGVKFDAHYRVTSVDPPELVRFIKKQYPDVSVDIPHDKDGKPITMWNLIPKKLMPPTRLMRYCCSCLKESGGKGRVTVTGVRWDESNNRKKNQGLVTIQGAKGKKVAQENKADYRDTVRGGIVLNLDNNASRRTVEQCFRTGKTILNPIIDWLNEDVWEFLNERKKVSHCCKYDEGYERLGCIGCPMNSRQEAKLNEYPKYRDSYLRAFNRMLEQRSRRMLETDFKTPEEVMDWWLGKAPNVNVLDGQMDIEDLMEVEYGAE